MQFITWSDLECAHFDYALELSDELRSVWFEVSWIAYDSKSHSEFAF